MPAVLLTPPLAEPIGLAEAKAFLRLDHDAEDDLVSSLVASARAEVEALTKRVLVAQRWRLDVKPFADGRPIRLRPRPVREVEAVRRRTADGSLTSLDPADWSFDWASETLRLASPVPRGDTIEIDLAVGYGPPEDVPDSLRLALRRLVADGFERRTAADGPRVDVAGLVAPYRELAL